jgi:hypothetical protein
MEEEVMRELCRILGLDPTEVEKARPRFMSWGDDDASWRDAVDPLTGRKLSVGAGL